MKRQHGLKRSVREEAALGWLLAGPWILGFIILTAGPMIASAYLSLTSWDGFGPARFVGLGNYVEAFTRDPLFWVSLRVTVIYALTSLPLQLLLALGLAVVLNQPVPGRRLFRTIFYLPSVLPGVAVALLWTLVLHPTFGVVNYSLWELFRIEGPNWLGSRKWALWSLVIMSAWYIGRQMIIFLAGLQGIPQEMHEAASLDGAGAFKRFRFVTLPLMSPIVFFNLVIGIISSFQVFNLAYVMTGGGPQYSTMFYMLLLYRNAFQFYKMGYASAQAWILFAIVAFLTVVQFRLAKRWVYTGDLQI